MLKEAKLALEDGTIFKGDGFGFETTKTGEVVFTTGMTGYVESLTDPSYKGQILISTYPLQGNYGVSSEWFQSEGIKAEGFIVRENNQYTSHSLSEKNLSEFLAEYEVPGISGIDTRALTLKIRRFGAMMGKKLSDFGLRDKIEIKHVAVKESIFPFIKIPEADSVLGPEMKSTGESMGIDDNFGVSYYKAQLSAGMSFMC